MKKKLLMEELKIRKNVKRDKEMAVRMKVFSKKKTLRNLLLMLQKDKTLKMKRNLKKNLLNKLRNHQIINLLELVILMKNLVLRKNQMKRKNKLNQLKVQRNKNKREQIYSPFLKMKMKVKVKKRVKERKEKKREKNKNYREIKRLKYRESKKQIKESKKRKRKGCLFLRRKKLKKRRKKLKQKMMLC